jgi:hypothetical protein
MSQVQDKNGFEDDYAYQPKSSGGNILRLKEKGEKRRLRLATKPYRIESTFKDDKTGEETVREQFVWGAIDKTEKEPRAVAFVGGLMIYLAVRNLATNDDWGNPNTYDIVVERTEKQGSYYVVTPIAKGMGPIAKEHLEMIDKLTDEIDLSDPFKKKGESTAKAPAADGEYDPFADTE